MFDNNDVGYEHVCMYVHSAFAVWNFKSCQQQSDSVHGSDWYRFVHCSASFKKTESLTFRTVVERKNTELGVQSTQLRT